MSTSKQQSTLRIYGCGGAGLNIANELNLSEDTQYLPDTKYSLIDTSESNIHHAKSLKGTPWLVPGVDGSGKDGKFAEEIVKPHLNAILLDNPPADFNIVVFSLSGGSGSSIGTLLVEELLKRNKSTIVVAIQSTADLKESTNSYRTLGKLQDIATNKVKKPVIISHYENTAGTPRVVVNAKIIDEIKALAILVSGVNEELDYQDLSNWLNFDKSTGIKPQLADLVINMKSSDNPGIPKGDIPAVISMASLLMSKSEEPLQVDSLYSCVGYFSEAAQVTYKSNIPTMEFMISVDYLQQRVETLNKRINLLKNSKEIIANTPIIEFDLD